MEKLFERFVFDSSRCYCCGSVVYAMEKRSTANHVYHNRCFRCRICRRNLTGASLNEEGDDIYCANCYGKKQRGDCNNRDFRRAANERAQFVFNRQHPDQPPPQENPRPPIQRGFSRQASWSLRQLERRFLSHQEPTNHDFQKTAEKFRQTVSVPNPVTIKTTFSVPGNITNIRRSLSLPRRQQFSPPSPLEFLPAYSPFPNIKNESTAAAPKAPPLLDRVNLRKISSFQDLAPQRSRTAIGSPYPKTSTSERHQNNIDSSHPRTPPSERRYSDIDSTYSRTPPSEQSYSTTDSPYPRTPPAERGRSIIDSSYLKVQPGERSRSTADSPYSRTPPAERGRSVIDSSYLRVQPGERSRSTADSSYPRTLPAERGRSPSDSPYPKTQSGERSRSTADSSYGRALPAERSRSPIDSPYPKTQPGERSRSTADSSYGRALPAERGRSPIDSPYPKTPPGERSRSTVDSPYARTPPSERHRSTINSPYARTPPRERKTSVIIELNKKYQSPTQKPEVFLFPDTPLTPSRRRTNSGNYPINLLKIN